MVWRKIDIFDGRFSINEDGDIINTRTNHQLKPYITNKGYKAVDLNCNGKRKKMLVHRLVAMTFIPNPNQYPVVMHLDDNRLNSNVNNLQWGTYLDNNLQAIREGHMKVPRPDNRKYYELYHPQGVVGRVCNGLIEAMEYSNIENDSTARNYIYRDTAIPNGPYAGYKIRKIR